MANKAKGFGLTAELERKKAEKFSAEKANEVMNWLKGVVTHADSNDKDLEKMYEVKTMEDVEKILKDGTILCTVINAMYPGSVKKVNKTTMAFKQMENISNFLIACEQKAGCNKTDLFQTVDLYESRNIPGVIDSLLALGRKGHDIPGIPGIGPKEATQNKREFTDEQLEAGKNVIGLQMGTNKLASQSGQNFGKTRAILD